MPVSPSSQQKSIVPTPEEVTAFLAKRRAYAAEQQGSVSDPASSEPPRPNVRRAAPINEMQQEPSANQSLAPEQPPLAEQGSAPADPARPSRGAGPQAAATVASPPLQPEPTQTTGAADQAR